MADIPQNLRQACLNQHGRPGEPPQLNLNVYFIHGLNQIRVVMPLLRRAGYSLTSA